MHSPRLDYTNRRPRAFVPRSRAPPRTSACVDAPHTPCRSPSSRIPARDTRPPIAETPDKNPARRPTRAPSSPRTRAPSLSFASSPPASPPPVSPHQRIHPRADRGLEPPRGVASPSIPHLSSRRRPPRARLAPRLREAPPRCRPTRADTRSRDLDRRHHFSPASSRRRRPRPRPRRPSRRRRRPVDFQSTLGARAHRRARSTRRRLSRADAPRDDRARNSLAETRTTCVVDRRRVTSRARARADDARAFSGVFGNDTPRRALASPPSLARASDVSNSSSRSRSARARRSRRARARRPRRSSRGQRARTR